MTAFLLSCQEKNVFCICTYYCSLPPPITSVLHSLYHFSAWIQAFASVINVNAACKTGYSHLCASITARIEQLCILDIQGYSD